MNLSITVLFNKLNISEYKDNVSITGPLWIDLNGFNFPDKFWFDFPVTILSWWLEEIEKIVLNKQISCECLFKDGPYYFKIIDKNTHNWQIKFFERGASEDRCLSTGFF